MPSAENKNLHKKYRFGGSRLNGYLDFNMTADIPSETGKML